MKTKKSGIKKAIEYFGSQTALAKHLGVRPQSVQQWNAKRLVPAQRCIDIERATKGAISAVELNPMIFGR